MSVRRPGCEFEHRCCALYRRYYRLSSCCCSSLRHGASQQGHKTLASAHHHRRSTSIRSCWGIVSNRSRSACEYVRVNEERLQLGQAPLRILLCLPEQEVVLPQHTEVFLLCTIEVLVSCFLDEMRLRPGVRGGPGVLLFLLGTAGQGRTTRCATQVPCLPRHSPLQSRHLCSMQCP